MSLGQVGATNVGGGPASVSWELPSVELDQTRGEPTFPLKECPENHIQLINVMFSTQEIIYYLAASFIYKFNRSQKSYFFIMPMTFLFRLCFLEAILPWTKKANTFFLHQFYFHL